MTGHQVPRLHLIGPLGGVTLAEYVALATRAVAGGVDAVHLRAPGHPSSDVLHAARSLRSRLGSAALIVNDRLDIALLAGADGVQLGEHSFGVDDARRVARDALIGRSVHDRGGAVQACRDGATFIVASHVFDTPSKPGTPGRGIAWLAEIVRAVATPVIALGGITIDRIPYVLGTGAHGIALGRELLGSPDPEAAATRARRFLDEIDPEMNRNRS